MSDLVKVNGNKYVARIRKFNGIKQELIAYIPLRTTRKDEAKVRQTQVNSVERDIKNGIIKPFQFEEYFKWLNEDRTSTLQMLTTAKSTEMFLESHSTNVRESSLARIKISLDRFNETLASNYPISHIRNEHIEEFKKEYSERPKPHSLNGINLNLRNIKTFLRWCVDEQHLNKMPKIKMFKVGKSKPKYLSESQFTQILSLQNLSEFYKRAFVLYVSIGARRSEVIQGKLEGNILIIPASLSKSGIEKEITLEQGQIKIVREIQTARDKHIANGYKIENFKNQFSIQFKKACNEIGIIRNFHCLRHTFAVRQYILTNSIYEVKKLMFHQSVTTTEIYANFNLDRLANDFPTDYRVRLEIEKLRKSSISTTQISTTNDSIRLLA